jgi:RNA polymerase sigma-70 factor (ECF subfamily)
LDRFFMMPFVPWSRARVDDAPALLARLSAGDAAALDQLYRREAGAVYRYALAMAGDAAAAADATHDAFVALATRPSGFDPARGELGAYLAGIARHTLLAAKRGAFEVLDDEQADAATVGTSLEELQVRRQSRDALWRAIRELPWPQREALVLVDLQERPYSQAAAIAGCELNTLRSRLHRARQRLATLLGAVPQELPT